MDHSPKHGQSCLAPYCTATHTEVMSLSRVLIQQDQTLKDAHERRAGARFLIQQRSPLNNALLVTEWFLMSEVPPYRVTLLTRNSGLL